MTADPDPGCDKFFVSASPRDELATLRSQLSAAKEEIERLRNALQPFVSDVQLNALAKHIHKKAKGFEPVSLTVTLRQFREGRAALFPEVERG